METKNLLDKLGMEKHEGCSFSFRLGKQQGISILMGLVIAISCSSLI